LAVYWEDEFNIVSSIANDKQEQNNKQQQAFFSKNIIDHLFQIFVFDEYLQSLDTLAVRDK
jgi:hypothetical protein